MCPALEQVAVLLDQPIEMMVFEARLAAEQDLVLGALDGADRVDLDEPQAAHHLAGPGRAARRRAAPRQERRRESVQRQKRSPDLAVVQLDGVHGGILPRPLRMLAFAEWGIGLR